jgi:RNA polymerase sigma-70 factor (ECF subfamily)
VDRRRDPRPWLFGIANNLIRRHHRAEERLIRSYAAIERQPETAGRNGVASVKVVYDAERAILA